MAIGMTYEQYWNDDPLLVRAFYKADRIRKMREDEAAWLNGLYVLSALNATVGNMFRQKGEIPAKYPDEPYTITREREEKEAKQQRESEKEALWAMAWMTSFVQAGKNWGKNKGKER